MMKNSPILAENVRVIINKIMYYMSEWEHNELLSADLHFFITKDVYEFIQGVESVSINFKIQTHGRIGPQVGKLETVEVQFNTFNCEPWEFETHRIIKAD